ncbi:MAG: hypothetical protein ACE5E9_00470 [Nitrospinaceae bacterium]
MNPNAGFSNSGTLGPLKAALRLARKFHAGQVRKGPGGEAFFHHPRRVCKCYLAFRFKTLEGAVASLCHDLVEDTSLECGELGRYFGKTVQRYVWELTKPWNLSSDKYGESIPLWSLESKKIKLCDIEDNILGSRKIPDGQRLRMLSRWGKYLDPLRKVSLAHREQEMEYREKWQFVYDLHSLEWNRLKGQTGLGPMEDSK